MGDKSEQDRLAEEARKKREAEEAAKRAADQAKRFRPKRLHTNVLEGYTPNDTGNRNITE